MTSVRELHLQAMEYAEEGQKEKNLKNFDSSRTLFLQALELEQQSALLATTEPTRSILYKSAAALALECNQTREAERLAALGLSGSPPIQVAYQLREIISRANFDMHLSLRGEVLSQDQLQITLDGDVVSNGIVLSDVFIQRISDLDKLTFRTGQRIRNLKFDEKASTRKRVANELSLFLALPRAGSYSVTVQIGVPAQLTETPMLPNISDASEIIDELMYCLDLVNKNEQEVLRQRIPDPAYFNSFVGISRRFAPDGSQVKLVGLTRFKNGKEQQLAITTPQNALEITPMEVVRPAERLSSTLKTVKGFLRFADSFDEQQIRIRPEAEEKPVTFIVPEGMMDDIVRPHWNTLVTVTGYRIGASQKYRLHTIDPG